MMQAQTLWACPRGSPKTALLEFLRYGHAFSCCPLLLQTAASKLQARVCSLVCQQCPEAASAQLSKLYIHLSLPSSTLYS